MRRLLFSSLAGILGCVIVGAGFAATATRPEPLAGLTYSGDQQPIEAVDREIVAAGTDAAKLAAIEKRLLEVLRRAESTFAARQAVAQRLALVLAAGAPRTTADAFKPLGAMLADERDADLARLALEPVGGDVVDGVFVAALEKSGGRARLGLIDSLGRRRASAAVATLARLLKDPDPNTAAAAARALGQIADPAAVAALHAIPEPSPSAVAAAKLTASALTPPAAALGLLNELQRNARDPVHRAAAFRQSLEIERGTAPARVVEVLAGNDWLMKQVAVESVAASRAPNLVSALTGKLATFDPPTQRAVIAALGRRGDAAATASIAAAATHADAEVRAAVIQALGLLPGTRETTALLAKMAAGADVADAKAARLALARLNGADVTGTILAGAESGPAALRAVYLEQLALRNMTEALPVLLKSRADRETPVRMAAVGALGEIAPASEQKALLDWTIEASDPAEQTRALRSLVNVTLRNPDIETRGAPIFALMENGQPDLALRLLPALGRLGGPASAQTAARLAIRDDAKISEAATNALTRWTDATALPALVTVVETAAQPTAKTAALEGALRYLERNRDPWTPETTDVVSRLLSATTEAASRKKLVALLHRANDPAALTLAEKSKSDAELGKAFTIAADVIRANLAGAPKLRASTSSGIDNMMDGKTSTRWSAPALGEEWIEVDFRLARPIQRITLDQTGRTAEFPEKYEVYVTDSPQQPGQPVVTGKGQRNRTVIDLPAETRGRYLIVKNVAERKDAPWAICELYVD